MLHSTSSPSSVAAATSARHDDVSVASYCRTRTGRPIAAAVSARPASLTSPSVSAAPSLAKRSAAARPMPDAAPVTSTFLPANRIHFSALDLRRLYRH